MIEIESDSVRRLSVAGYLGKMSPGYQVYRAAKKVKPFLGLKKAFVHRLRKAAKNPYMIPAIAAGTIGGIYAGKKIKNRFAGLEEWLDRASNYEGEYGSRPEVFKRMLRPVRSIYD